MMRPDVSAALVCLRFSLLESIPHLRHAITTRIGGGSLGSYATANLGLSVGDDRETVLRNRQHAAALVAGGDVHPVTVQQVHGVEALLATEPGRRGEHAGKADMLMTETPGVALLIQVADCVPVILVDPVRQALALVHAGWRGTAACAGREAVAAMQRRFGSRADDLRAGIGPAIGICCYEVGNDVASAVEAASGGPTEAITRRFDGSAPHIALGSALEAQLVASGVRHERIEQAGVCNGCNLDLFYSHRREGEPTGRYGIVAALGSVR